MVPRLKNLTSKIKFMAINKQIKKIIFLTGTRADFGKLKPLIQKLNLDSRYEVHIFVTGMHMLSKFGLTLDEVKNTGYKNIYSFINQNSNDSMDHVLAKTITGLSDYTKEIKPDLIVVHGDRIEALAGAIVGSLNNTLVAHIEGGEVSGTIDELLRHAISKLSHLHFVANKDAKERLIQLGERKNQIFEIGSPDIDIMNSKKLPDIKTVKSHYKFDFSSYSILLFHPVTSDLDSLVMHVQTLVNAIILSGLNYIVIFPNNDPGHDLIMNEYSRFKNNPNIKIYPSMRFEYFLTLLKNAKFIIGNSSAGVREAPHFGVPAINIGERQLNRVKCDLIINVGFNELAIINSMKLASKKIKQPISQFGNGESAAKFYDVIKTEFIWQVNTQKYFVDIER